MKTRMSDEIKDKISADSNNAHRITKAVLESKYLMNVEVIFADGSKIVLSNQLTKKANGSTN